MKGKPSPSPKLIVQVETVGSRTTSCLKKQDEMKMVMCQSGTFFIEVKKLMDGVTTVR